MSYRWLFFAGFPDLCAPGQGLTSHFPDHYRIYGAITRLTILFATIPRLGTQVFTARALLRPKSHDLLRFEAIPWSLLRQLRSSVQIGFASTLILSGWQWQNPHRLEVISGIVPWPKVDIVQWLTVSIEGELSEPKTPRLPQHRPLEFGAEFHWQRSPNGRTADLRRRIHRHRLLVRLTKLGSPRAEEGHPEAESDRCVVLPAYANL